MSNEVPIHSHIVWMPCPHCNYEITGINIDPIGSEFTVQCPSCHKQCTVKSEEVA